MKKLSKSEKNTLCINFLFNLCFRDKNIKKCFNEYASKYGLDDDVILVLLESSNISEDIDNKMFSESEAIIKKYLELKSNTNNTEDFDKNLI